jgi:hypothetical protein
VYAVLSWCMRPYAGVCGLTLVYAALSYWQRALLVRLFRDIRNVSFETLAGLFRGLVRLFRGVSRSLSRH